MTASTATPPRRAAATTLGEQFAIFRAHPNARIEATVVVVLAVARLLAGASGTGDAVTVAVILAAQPFFEWSFHLYVLHYRPVTVLGRAIDFELARKHREHHADPSVVDLVFVPRRSLLLFMALATTGALLAFPTVSAALTALLTSAMLLLGYEWVHFLIHSRYRPRSRLFRAVWRAHRLHHFKNEQYWLGVTNPAADYVLRTYPDPAGVPTSPTARDLAAG